MGPETPTPSDAAGLALRARLALEALPEDADPAEVAGRRGTLAAALRTLRPVLATWPKRRLVALGCRFTLHADGGISIDRRRHRRRHDAPYLTANR